MPPIAVESWRGSFKKIIAPNVSLIEKALTGKLVIPNIDHTLGTLIANGMRKHSAVSFAGYNMPHPLDKTVEIHYKLTSGSLKKVIKDVVGYYNEVYNGIEQKINKF